MKIKSSSSLARNGSILLALVLGSCSQGPTAPSASNNKGTLALGGGDGTVNGSLSGDVKAGPVDIDMNLVRVAQTDGAAFYANPGGEYTVLPGRSVEIYVQIWTSNPLVATPPRVIVDWGAGERDIIHCGPCRLSRTYGAGRYRVTVTLDDRASSTSTRTFILNVGTPGAVASGFGTFSGTLTVSDPQFTRAGGSFVPPATGPCSAGNVTYYDAYQIDHLGGPMRIETTAAALVIGNQDTYVHIYAGSFNPGSSCQNIVASDDDSAGSGRSLIQGTFPAGHYVAVVTTFDALDTGTYTLVIQ